MLGITDFWMFVAAAILVNLTPGQDTFYILGRTISQGVTAGMASVLGIGAGVLVHTLAAALGLSALLSTSAQAFFLVKMVGAAYLIYLGIGLIVRRSEGAAIPDRFQSSDFWLIFRQGLLTNVLNPKVAIFFLAFMPQFVSPASTNTFLSLLVLGLCFVTTGVIWCTILALGAAAISERLRGSRTLSDVLNRTAGAVFILLGVRLATSR